MHFYYDAQNRPAMVNFNGTYYMYLHNLQGDVVGLVDSSNNIVVEYRYDAWGKPTLKRSLTTAYDTLATLNPFRYRGYVYDEETGLYYLRSRYYNPVWGRFVNADSIIAYMIKINCHSLYTYCINNPIMYCDPEGFAFSKNINRIALQGAGNNIPPQNRVTKTVVEESKVDGTIYKRKDIYSITYIPLDEVFDFAKEIDIDLALTDAITPFVALGVTYIENAITKIVKNVLVKELLRAVSFAPPITTIVESIDVIRRYYIKEDFNNAIGEAFERQTGIVYIEHTIQFEPNISRAIPVTTIIIDEWSNYLGYLTW